ncbi:heparinase II/III family protein [uncultured Cellulomonas sp.]|uniref:heparinase II/III domain-containing protein n=1 Tax=uncultured Cellulomonas sp. TaxID=189682 RepID=UPI00262222F7|nr:heparinase II/III family protein [uncultured Cellulomonas sp.]
MTTSPAFDGPLTRAWHAAVTAAGHDPASAPLTGGLPVPTAEDRSVWDLAAGTADIPTRHELLARAGAERGTPWPQPTAHAFARFFRDGDRLEYEGTVAARQQRLTRAAVAAASTLDPAWLDDVADGVTLLCEQSTWCWAAHDDTRRRHGSVVPTVTDPFVDLGAGEVVAQLAWVDHLLGARLDDRYPGLRRRVRHEARVRVLEPFVRRRDWHWLGLDGDVHNWNPWIHGNVLVAALGLLADDSERADVVRLVVEGLDRYVAVLPDDGAVDEGYAYWWNGACRALEALDVLGHASGHRIASRVPALRATVAFPHRMHLGADWYLNLADGQARPPSDQPWHALHRAAQEAGDQDARRHAAAHRVPGGPVATEREGLGRLLRSLTDRAWSAADPAAGSPLPRDTWLPSTEVLVARATEGSTHGLTLAVKGGHNGEHHNHNDVGSVVVALGGVPVVVDAGRPTYTAQTFGPDRYELWTMQSQWHTVPTVRGTGQSPGRRFGARHTVAEVTGARAALHLDLAGAYDRPDVRHWWRTAGLDRTSGAVTIEDRWDLAPDPTPAPSSCVHVLLAGDVVLDGRRAVVTALAGAGTVALTWAGTARGAHLEIRRLDDPMLGEVWGERLTRLVIDVGDAPTGSLTMTVGEIR